MRRAISVDKLSLTVNPGAFAVTDSGFGIVWGNLCSQSVKVLEAQISCKGFSISYKILILLVLIQLIQGPCVSCPVLPAEVSGGVPAVPPGGGQAWTECDPADGRLCHCLHLPQLR